MFIVENVYLVKEISPNHNNMDFWLVDFFWFLVKFQNLGLRFREIIWWTAQQLLNTYKIENFSDFDALCLLLKKSTQ